MLSFSGPPFTHQRTPRKMVYYGQTSCEQDTERYIDVVKYVFSSYRKEVPLVINTMGWVKGKHDESVLEGWCRGSIMTWQYIASLCGVRSMKTELTPHELLVVFCSSVQTALCGDGNRVFSAP